MTSSERHLTLGQTRWNKNKQKYKSIKDLFLEPGLFSIIVLAHGRPEMTRRSVLSTIDCLEFCQEEIEWIFVENGQNKANAAFFHGLKLERKVVIHQCNYGINEGFNQGWAVSRGEFIMIHENDWLNNVHKFDFLKVARDIFDSRESIGIIQLRDPFDKNQNFGFGLPDHNPWSCSPELLASHGIRVWQETSPKDHRYFVSQFPNGFNNNPILMRKSLYRECGPYPEAEVGSDPRHGEGEYQARVAATGSLIAYIGIPIYKHIGWIQTPIEGAPKPKLGMIRDTVKRVIRVMLRL